MDINIDILEFICIYFNCRRDNLLSIIKMRLFCHKFCPICILLSTILVDNHLILMIDILCEILNSHGMILIRSILSQLQLNICKSMRILVLIDLH